MSLVFGQLLFRPLLGQVFGQLFDTDKSHDCDSEEDPKSLRGRVEIAFWDTLVTDHIRNRSGVMVRTFIEYFEYWHYLNFFG